MNKKHWMILSFDIIKELAVVYSIFSIHKIKNIISSSYIIPSMYCTVG